ncbi:hypothetical protein TNCV_3896711 [Trichonephila clavipes]|nr:hypothetical protein TNCV_3896711 [Trichonephila clavipes]
MNSTDLISGPYTTTSLMWHQDSSMRHAHHELVTITTRLPRPVQKQKENHRFSDLIGYLSGSLTFDCKPPFMYQPDIATPPPKNFEHPAPTPMSVKEGNLNIRRDGPPRKSLMTPGGLRTTVKEPLGTSYDVTYDPRCRGAVATLNLSELQVLILAWCGSS